MAEWTEEEIAHVRELSRKRALAWEPHPQAEIILAGTRENLIRLTENQGLRVEVEEQIESSLEACDLDRLRRFLAYSWEPESLQEGLEMLHGAGFENPAAK